MKIKELNAKNPEYNADLISKYALLYEGGQEFLENVTKFLPKRLSEGTKLYNERISRAFYIGYVGPVIDFFTSNLFAFNANINIEGSTEGISGNPFYDEFTKNVDLKGTDINQFFKNVFTETLIHQSSFIMVDFPRLDENVPAPLNRKEEIERGLDRAYLCHFPKSALIDWQFDTEIGNFEWVKFHTEERYKPAFDKPEMLRHTWCIYTKTEYEIYQYDQDLTQTKGKTLEEIDIPSIANGLHSMSKFNRVPVYCLDVTDGLWIMNKLASVQCELFNLDNALAWQEYQGHFAMPVIKLKEGKEFKQKMGESYYIKLEVDESFEWTEPEGQMMEVGLKRRQMLMEELHRIVQQLSLSIKQTKSQTRQSGSSKQEDRHSTEVILRAFGDIIRLGMQNILDWVSAAREDKLTWDVTGFEEFDTESTTEKLAQILQLRAINLHSEKFNKEIEKRVVDFYLEDANHATKEEIKKEIDAFDFSSIIEPPDLVFAKGSFEGGGYQQKPPAGTTQPNKVGQKPNGTSPKSKPQPKGSNSR